ncbi:serine protease [Streptomyces sp. S.PB5]|uniref:S1 family serine peptidase n=1 Tax=Streptomyces sp. S.PB5 TaxID=3020844 RepID=UPI0025AEEAAD|nr:serine protease [Streptomyces sp. S.PB5]MDN3022750.1 serine protease [Streptomyces sp. S.PB5]
MPLRRIIVSVTTAVGLALAGAPPAGAVVGGRDAGPDTAPFQVALIERGQFVCGGFLRDATTVVTAAHCVEATPADALTVRLDGVDRTRLAQSRDVAAVVQHPGFEWKTGADDAALLELAAPVAESDTVKYARLATADPAPGAELTVTGWGVTQAGARTPATMLQAARERVISPGACRAAAGGTGLGSLMGRGADGALCAGSVTAGTGFCSGDSGGPAVVDGVVVGIVSRNVDCGRGYDIYTSVARFNGWLTQQL